MTDWTHENVKRLRKWAGQTQAEAAASIGIKQPTWSGFEKGNDSLSERILTRYIEQRTPTVLFIIGDSAGLVAQAMLAVEQVEAITGDSQGFLELLRSGKHIAVLSQPASFLQIIGQAEQDSGLSIPVLGLMAGADGAKPLPIKNRGIRILRQLSEVYLFNKH